MTTTSSPPRPTRASFPLRDYPSVVWLGLAVVVALGRRWVPESGWLLVHLVLLGAMTHAAMVWSNHFAQALLKTSHRADERARQSRRIVLLLAGCTLVLVGVPAGWWPLTALGALSVGSAVLWHGLTLYRQMRRALPGRFRVTVRYYVAAAACVPFGALFGALLARDPAQPWHAQLLVAHSVVLVLGWLGLTMTGTLVTLWPTMLRTRIDDRAETLARQALPALVGTLALIAGAALTGQRWLVVAGVALYAGALGWWGRALLRPARRRPPHEFATFSVSAALCWYAVGVGWVLVTVARSADWAGLPDDYGAIAAAFAAGFAAQLLTGALSYLLPVVLGGGPAAVRSAQAWLNRATTLRVTVTNAALVLCLAPVPNAVRVLCSLLVLASLAAFIPLAAAAVRANLQARGNRVADQGEPIPAATPTRASPAWSPVQLIAGLSAVAIAVSLGLAIDPAAAGLAGPTHTSSTAVIASGRTSTVQVSAKEMRFTPGSITVPVGDRLLIELVNEDQTTTHDLVLDNGTRTPRLGPGGRATLDAGVVAEALDGWCSVVGHRQMGMTFRVSVSGTAHAGEADGHAAHAPAAAASPPVDLTQRPGEDFTASDPVLPALTAETVHRVTFRVRELELQVAPGVWQRRWTFNGQSPGPPLHGRVGDVFEVTLVNEGSMGHSIDFHAGALAPDQPMRTIAPGQSLLYRFTATRAGIWMYHCSTMPMSAHISAGMHGAVVIDPPDLTPVDRSYLLVQSEITLGQNHGAGSASEVDADKVTSETPDAVVFNGVAYQYDYRRLAARVGERVRIWVLDAGPNRPTSFHVVGGQFDTVYAEGAWLLRPGPNQAGGSQVLALGPSQGGFVELSFPETGTYPLVSHLMVDAERGAHGTVAVTR